MGNPLDSWAASIEAGKAAEAAILITFYKYLGIRLEDNTKENHKNPDLRGEVLLDSKILRTAYPKDKTPAGLSSAEHLTLDYANLFDYPPETLLVMTVDYTGSGLPTKGIYLITAERARDIVNQHPNRIYTRSRRSASDKDKKVGISTRECARIAFPAMTLADSAEEVMLAQKHPLVKVVHPDIE